MRKSALLKLLALTFVVASVIGVFSACGSVSGNQSHVHEFEYTTTNATCTQEGSVLGLCKCGESIVKTLPKTAHNYVNYICNVCGHALEVTPNEYFNFTLLSDDTYEISTKDRNNMPENLVLPCEYNGKPVTSIGSEAFIYCDSLTSIEIPDSVTSIGEMVFMGCTSLTSIAIPDSVTSIGAVAFGGCPLISITVSENNANYSSLNGNLYNKDKTTIVQYAVAKRDQTFEMPNSVTFIGDYAFIYCDSLTSIEIPDSVTSIGEGAFAYCYSLTSVVIGNGVTSIGAAAFWGCPLISITVSENNANYSSLNGDLYSKEKTTLIQYAAGKTDSEFKIPDSVTSVGDSAFVGCNSLNSVEIPDSVTSIGENAFSGCHSLTSVVIGNGVTSIGDYAFTGCDSLTSVVIGNGVTSIGEWTFASCSSLTSVEIPDSVTSIGDLAFFNCSSLTSVVIGDSVTSIGNYAFSGCSSLTSVVIGDSVTSIGDWAFCECNSLTSVVIPDSVTSIGYAAFEGCSALKIVYYKGTQSEWNEISIDSSNSKLTNATRYYYSESQPTEEGNYWHYNANGEIEVWEIKTLEPTPNEYFNFTLLSDDTYEISAKDVENMPANVVIPCEYNGKPVTSIKNEGFALCKLIISVQIPDNISVIGDLAFAGCNLLTSITVSENNANYCSLNGSLYSKDKTTLIQYAIGKEDNHFTIPDGVTSICTAAFAWSGSLTSVEISNSVTYVGTYAFWYCGLITSVVMGNGVTEIAEGAFDNCTALTSIQIGNNVTKIGYRAFAYCSSLVSVIISGSVTEIGNFAFAYCSALSSIKIPDSVTSIGYAAFTHCGSLAFVEIGNGVTCIDNWTFENCSSLTSIVIGGNVNLIKDKATVGCSSLKNIYYKGVQNEWNQITIDGANSYLTSATRYYYSESEPSEDSNFWHYVDGELVVW